MLRLADSNPPLWRTPSSVQLGPDDRRPLEGLSLWQERLLDELLSGIPDARFASLARELGASEQDAADFLARIGSALAPAPTTPREVRVELPAELHGDAEATIRAALGAAGLRVAGMTRWTVDDARDRTPVLLVAHRLADPMRVARLLAADVPHLPVHLHGDRVTIGPLVLPGQGPCLACVHATRADADPEWPLVAAQLLARPAPTTEPMLLLEATVLAARLLRTSERGRSVAISAADARREWRGHRPHERCWCRSPAGTSSADAPAPPSSEPTTGSTYARPA
jgi:bacteriocin biosynthesis cyclodehydratase domain-containing protein